MLEGSWDARSVSSLELDSGYGEEAGGPQGKGAAGGQRCSTRGEGVAGGGSPGKLAAASFRPAQPSGWPIWNHLAPTPINPWQTPGLLHLLSAEMGVRNAEPHRTPQGTLRGLDS